MRKIKFLLTFFMLLPIMSAQARELRFDTLDPLFLESGADFLSKTNIDFGQDIVRASQRFSYGIKDYLAIGANIRYQNNFEGPQDGFSNVGFDLTYRLSNYDSRQISDIMVGVNLENSGSKVFEFSENVYSIGWRMGRQWSWLTLAGAIKTSWIFDKDNGTAFINFMPDIYFRIYENWNLGLGADFQKSTNPLFDKEWAKLKIARRWGRTMYVGTFDYEFEMKEFRGGFQLNILF